MKFYKIRSFIGHFFSEHQQMRIVILLSSIFWSLRKYFLGISLSYDKKFIKNWNYIKKNHSSQDKIRNFDLYQLLKIHNKIFKNKKTNIIEFGVSRGTSLRTIAKFCKNNTRIFGVDQFGDYSNDILISKKHDLHYTYEPFKANDRFRNFNYKNLNKILNEQFNKKNKFIYLIKLNIKKDDDLKKIKLLQKKKFSFIHLDLDLFHPTLEVIKYLQNKIEKNGIMIIDDYNNINQTGVRKAIYASKLDKERTFESPSGQLFYFNI
jgi:hypothetical protein